MKPPVILTHGGFQMRFTKVLAWPKLFALAAGVVATTNPAFAEFEIQEATIEKGEVEIEYRGAYDWGVPEVTDVNENANDLVQSNELELQMGITDWWMISVTSG